MGETDAFVVGVSVDEVDGVNVVVAVPVDVGLPEEEDVEFPVLEDDADIDEVDVTDADCDGGKELEEVSVDVPVDNGDSVAVLVALLDTVGLSDEEGVERSVLETEAVRVADIDELGVAVLDSDGVEEPVAVLVNVLVVVLDIDAVSVGVGVGLLDEDGEGDGRGSSSKFR